VSGVAGGVASGFRAVCQRVAGGGTAGFRAVSERGVAESGASGSRVAGVGLHILAEGKGPANATAMFQVQDGILLQQGQYCL
jgi:hypothetical protein